MPDDTYQRTSSRLGREVRKDTQEIISSHVTTGIALQRILHEAKYSIITADAEMVLLEKAQSLQRAQSEFAKALADKTGRRI